MRIVKVARAWLPARINRFAQRPGAASVGDKAWRYLGGDLMTLERGLHVDDLMTIDPVIIEPEAEFVEAGRRSRWRMRSVTCTHLTTPLPTGRARSRRASWMGPR